MPTLTKKSCLRLIELIEEGQYALAAEALEHAFDWDEVPPGRTFWEAAYQKLRQVKGESRVTVVKRDDPQSWEQVPMKDFLEALPITRKK